MSGVLIAFTLVILVPLFVAKWRTSVVGLSLQGALLAWLALPHGLELSLDSALAAVDLVCLRMIIGPAMLFGMMLDRNGPLRNDVIAPNLFSWVIVIGLVVVAFRAASAFVPAEGDEQSMVAVASAAFVLGLFVLATARGTFSQIIGLLRMENAIALFELGSHSEHAVQAELRVAKVAVFLISIAFYRWYLADVRAPDGPATETAAL